MNIPRYLARGTNGFFRPALYYLNKSSNPRQPANDLHRRTNSAISIDGTEDYYDEDEHHAQMDGGHLSRSSTHSLSELQAVPPLIDLGSRSTSPYPRTRSAAQSEDEDDDFEPADSIRPLVKRDFKRGKGSHRGIWREGGLGAFLFGTWTGWQIWVAVLVFWVGGCGFGLMLMNRFIMLTGVYKFPFPLTHTYIQLILTHILLVGFSSLTRALGGPLRRLGFGAAVAPAYPVAAPGGFRAPPKQERGIVKIFHWLTNGSGAIAGGGLLEFDTGVAKQVLPLAIVFCLKVVLSNFSFAYAPLPVYQLARIGITPLALIFSCVLEKGNYNGSTLSSALIAALFLFFASLRTHVRVTEESIVAGVFSSFFVALYPIMLLRTYRNLVSGLVPQGDILTGYPSSTDDYTTNREETRAYYRVLHYTSLLSIAILTPFVLISGGVGKILHNIPFLDVPFFWLMIWCGAIGSFSVFVSTLLLVKATSPLTTTFVAIPRTAFQLAMVNLFKLPAASMTGVILCWISSLWFLVARRDQGRNLDRLRLEGR